MAKEHNKNRNWIWIGIIVVTIIVLVIVFMSNSNNNSQNSVTCNSPYIKVGNSCCLDQNQNNICDTDESQTTSQIVVESPIPLPKDEYRIQIFAIGCQGAMYVGAVRAIELVVYKNNKALYNFSGLTFDIYMDGELVSSGQPYYDKYYATTEGITLFKFFEMRCTQPDISTVKIVLKDLAGNELNSIFGKYTFDGDVSKYLPSDTRCQNGICSGSG